MEIRWAEAAANDLTNLFDYISEKAPVQASRFVGEVYQSVAQLERFPEIGQAGRVEGTREFNVSPYIIVYRLEGSAVVILSVVHAGQEYPR
jgi:toxin ParE1/3/4